MSQIAVGYAAVQLQSKCALEQTRLLAIFIICEPARSAIYGGHQAVSVSLRDFFGLRLISGS